MQRTGAALIVLAGCYAHAGGGYSTPTGSGGLTFPSNSQLDNATDLVLGVGGEIRGPFGELGAGLEGRRDTIDDDHPLSLGFELRGDLVLVDGLGGAGRRLVAIARLAAGQGELTRGSPHDISFLDLFAGVGYGVVGAGVRRARVGVGFIVSDWSQEDRTTWYPGAGVDLSVSFAGAK